MSFSFALLSGAAVGFYRSCFFQCCSAPYFLALGVAGPVPKVSMAFLMIAAKISGFPGAHRTGRGGGFLDVPPMNLVGAEAVSIGVLMPPVVLHRNSDVVRPIVPLFWPIGRGRYWSLQWRRGRRRDCCMLACHGGEMSALLSDSLRSWVLVS